MSPVLHRHERAWHVRAVLRSITRRTGALAPIPPNALARVVIETRPDPGEHMSDAERRYHLGHQHGR